MSEDAHTAIDSVLRSLRREVWIITAAAGDRRGGLLATWVSPASLDPEKPVVMVGIAKSHCTAELIEQSGAFALHLIGKSQIGHAWNFALGSGRDRDKLAGLDTETAASGAPVLCDCLAWLDCRVAVRLDGGDRYYYWADVLAGERISDESPLTDDELMAFATAEQRSGLLADLTADIELQRPLLQAWRDELPEALRPRSDSGS